VRNQAIRKRGRPLKFGKPGRVVALTLPNETVNILKNIHSDLAWAIVTLSEKRSVSTGGRQSPPPLAELVEVADGQCLIVVDGHVFKRLPGVQIIPLHGDRAFLALEAGRGFADLEVAVIDQIDQIDSTSSPTELRALKELREHLRGWRLDPNLILETRSIIVVGRRRTRRR